MKSPSSVFLKIIAAFRPKTLTAALVPCVVGSAWAFSRGLNFQWSLLVYALVSAFAIQIATNLFNDAIDFKKGADTEKRIGPQRITQSGALPSRVVLMLGGIFLLIAVAAGIPLLWRGGEAIFWIGIFSLFLAYGYTGGPFPLAYLGLGDLFVILFFGIIAVMGMGYLHSLQWSFETFVLGLQVGFHATVLIAINNLRDRETDRLVGKRTLAVRLGVQASRFEIAALIWLPFLLQLFWVRESGGWMRWTPYIWSPFAFVLTKNLFTNEPGPVYNQYLGKAALLHLGFGLLLSAGFVVS